MFKFLKDMLTVDNSTLNMLSLTFSYEHECNNLVNGFDLSVKDNMDVFCKIAGAQCLRFQRSNSLRCLPVCLGTVFNFKKFLF